MKLARLTGRQSQVLAMAAQGLTAKQIGQQLGLSYRTIHIFNEQTIMRLGALNTTHAVAIAISKGIIDPVSSDLPEEKIGSAAGRQTRAPHDGEAPS